MTVWVILACILAAVCVLNLCVLRAKPEHVGLSLDDEYDLSRRPASSTPPARGIPFWQAWLLPGVIPLSLSYTCLKLTNYSIMLWLPTFAVSELNFHNREKALIAVLYDVGTLVGALILGLLTDLLHG